MFYSIRRNVDRGAYDKYTLNKHLSVSSQIDLFILDERYERSTLPCDTRREYCRNIVFADQNGYSLSKNDKDQVPWCYDFLYGSGYPDNIQTDDTLTYLRGIHSIFMLNHVSDIVFRYLLYI